MFSFERPYKTWITTPLIFCAVALFLLLMPIIAAPLEALAVLGEFFALIDCQIDQSFAIGFVLAGVPVYYLTRRPDSESASRITLLLCAFRFCRCPTCT